jgi:trigger factor
MANEKKQDIKTSIIEEKPCSVIMSVEIPHPEVASETEKVYEAIQKEATVPGFRQGKAPMELIKKNYTNTAREKIIGNLIRRTVFSTLQSKGIEPLDTPVIDEITFDFDKPFIYTMKAERHPEFKVKDYQGLKVTKEIHPVTEAKIKENIAAVRERNARLVESKSETVCPDSFIMVDYDCFQGNEPLSDLKAKNQLVDLSAPHALAGFKEGLLGARKNEEREIKVTMPADYPNKKLANQEVTFKVKVLEIKDKVLPNLDDEFAKDFGLASLAELEGKVKESLETEEKNRQMQEVEKQIVDQLLESNKFPVPDSLVEEQKNYLLNRLSDYFKRQGISEEEWKKNKEQWAGKYQEEAERNVRISYILNAVAREEKIDASDEDMAKELERLKQANPQRPADVEKYFSESKSRIASHLKEEKIFAFLMDHAKIKEEVKEEKKS